MTSPELLPNLTRQFDLLRKGCKSIGLGSWEDQFGSMQDDARAGKIKAEDIVEIIDSDYRNERGGRETLTQFIEALLTDALTRAPSTVGVEDEWVNNFDRLSPQFRKDHASLLAKSASDFKAPHPPRMSAQGERDPSAMSDCSGAGTSSPTLASEKEGGRAEIDRLNGTVLAHIENENKLYDENRSLRSQLDKANSALNDVQFIAILEVLEECADFVPDELEARAYNLLDYHRDHDTASKLRPYLTDDLHNSDA